MPLKRALVTGAANTGPFEGSFATMCVNDRKPWCHMALARSSSTLKAHFILRGVQLNHRHCSFSSFPMDSMKCPQEKVRNNPQSGAVNLAREETKSPFRNQPTMLI